jgi:hypothetical protein
MLGMGTGRGRGMIYEAVGRIRRKIRLIESNVKCRHLKKLACKGTLRHVFYLSAAHSPPMTPILSPFAHCRLVLYSILIHTGKGGGGRANQRER